MPVATAEVPVVFQVVYLIAGMFALHAGAAALVCKVFKSHWFMGCARVCLAAVAVMALNGLGCAVGLLFFRGQ